MTRDLSREIAETRRRTADGAMSPTEQAELHRAIDAAVQQRSRGWIVGLLVTVGVGAAAAAIWLPGSEGLIEIQQGDECVSVAAGVVNSRCGATLLVAGDSIELDPATELVVEKRRVRMRRGRARFRVVAQSPQLPRFEVRVSHGVIAVIGTVFAVEQTDRGGSVDVVTGRVSFLWDDGTRTDVRRGQSVRWPRPEPTEETPAAPPAPTTEDPSERTTTKKKKAPAGGAIVKKLLLLRSQGKYQQAARLLRDALGNDRLGRKDRERFSYELGLLFDSKLPDRERECKHWRAHARSFPQGAFADDVDRQLADCDR